ncbi:hypothetical protein DKX38_025802 [Salix brachista]|uniref:Uncharacterized protein n=1 Tax=Salix brachista TaxID=2182728 RepID=A0A5N5JV94_9ROSI|nr:hypothetical protein DKX38_025802 [Salix brachista]
MLQLWKPMDLFLFSDRKPSCEAPGSARQDPRFIGVTEEDDETHKYQVPANDYFVHLEVQFKLFHLSSKADGELGRTCRPDFENPAKPGVGMPILEGEGKCRTASLFSADCASCIFSPESGSNQETSLYHEVSHSRLHQEGFCRIWHCLQEVNAEMICDSPNE